MLSTRFSVFSCFFFFYFSLNEAQNLHFATAVFVSDNSMRISIGLGIVCVLCLSVGQVVILIPCRHIYMS